MQFNWHPDEPPPPIEPHSKAKLQVLRNYLRAYFDRLGTVYARDEFKLDLVDGFAGGGTFLDGSEIISGTPLIMLEEARKAKKRLAHGRSKPIRFDFKFYFVDANAAHTDHLRRAMAKRGYNANDEAVVIRTGKFEDNVRAIVREIKKRQPRAGRSLFLLDQFGYSQVALRHVARILSELPRAEVILTFAADALINFLRDKPEFVKAVAPLEMSDTDVRELLDLKKSQGGKALVQRALRTRLRQATAARFDTPFFIRPTSSARALWFVHLSRHPTARDVMVQRHWDLANTFEHFGPGGLNMLGWDERGEYPLFRFGDVEHNLVHEQLLASMPAEIHALAAESPVTVDAIRHMLANRTAARFSDLDGVLLDLYKGRELEIRLANGNLRGSSTMHLNSTDLITLPPQRSLFGRGGGGRQRVTDRRPVQVG